MQKKIVSMIGFVAALMMIGCTNPHPGDLHDNSNLNNQPAVNNNNSGTNTNTNYNQPPATTTFKITARSSDKLAVWAQVQTGEGYFGPVLSTETCEGVEPSYEFNLTKPSVFLISASLELWVDANTPVELFTINQDPDDPWGMRVFRYEIMSFWGFDPFWEINRFPTTMAEADGLKYSVNAFICGMRIDAINLGCNNVFEDAFFISEGRDVHFYFEEEDYGPIFILGVLR